MILSLQAAQVTTTKNILGDTNSRTEADTKPTCLLKYAAIYREGQIILLGISKNH